MRIDCHVHTSRFSACSSLDPLAACETARARGLDAIVLTEHHRLWDRTEARAFGSMFPGLSVYSGMEITLQEGYDIVVIPGGDFSCRPFVPFAEVREYLDAAGFDSFVFVAHPFRYTLRQDKNLRAIMEGVDGIEMNSVNIMRSGGQLDCPAGDAVCRPANSSLYERAKSRFGLVPMYNSDAHAAASVGTICGEIDSSSPPRDESALIELLKASRPVEVQNVPLLKSLLYR